MPDWTEDAACAGWEWPDEFYQPRGIGTKQLRSLCNACPVNLECLKWAIEHEPWGYWAGTDEAMRDALRRRNGIKLQPVGDWTPPRQHTVPPECGTIAAAEWHRAKGEPMDEQCARALRYAERKRLKFIADKKKRESA